MRDMPELGDDARAVIEGAKGGYDPNAADRLRVRRALAALGAAGVSTSLAGAPRAMGWLSGKGVAAKVIAAALIAAGAGGLFILHTKASAPRAPRAAEVSPAENTNTPSQPAFEGAKQRAVPPPHVAPVVSRQAAPATHLVPSPRAAGGGRRTSPRASGLAEETAELASVQEHLRAGEPARAWALLRGYDRRFPRALLQEEAAAARVLTLLDLGRTTEGCRARSVFLARWPRSPLAGRMRDVCPAP